MQFKPDDNVWECIRLVFQVLWLGIWYTFIITGYEKGIDNFYNV